MRGLDSRELIGANTFLLRKAHGITQVELAQALGYTRQWLSKIERGTGNPRLSCVDEIASYFGIGCADLLAPLDSEAWEELFGCPQAKNLQLGTTKGKKDCESH